MSSWKYSFERLTKHDSGCKASEGQRSLYNWFKPKETKQVEQIEEEEEYDSDNSWILILIKHQII
ncbi:hypothetical protein C1646_819550 [Rhizophagus diaphanus]|nr:hypothetical protein C1646_819550 [Rhizophagus diaphanus] [Rhizophagus sp. MUCL 43196]